MAIFFADMKIKKSTESVKCESNMRPHLAVWVRPATLGFLDVLDVFPGHHSNQTTQNETDIKMQVGSSSASQLPWNHTGFPAQRVAFPRGHHLVSHGSS